MFCAAVSVSVGAVPPGGVAAAKNSSHASPRTRVRAARQQIRQRIECRQRRRLRTVQGILDHRAQAAGREIHQIGHIPCGDPQAERVPFDRGAVDELRVRPHRGDRRQLVDHDAGRRLAAQHRHQRHAVVVAVRLVSGGFATLCNQIAKQPIRRRPPRRLAGPPARAQTDRQRGRMLSCLDSGTMASEDLCGEGGHFLDDYRKRRSCSGGSNSVDPRQLWHAAKSSLFARASHLGQCKPSSSRVCPSGNSGDFQHVLVLISLRPAPFRGSRRAGNPGSGQDIRINLPQEHLVLL